jgi:large subunit ribosomal protein L24
VSLIDPDGGSATRVGFKFLEDNRKVRYAKRSGEMID